MEKAQIAAYNETVFNLPVVVKEDMLKDKQVAVGINPLLRYKDDTDAIGCQVRIVYSVDDMIIMEYGAVLTVVVEGWKEILKKNLQEKDLIASSREAWELTLGFVRGAISANATKMGNAIIARMLLPNVDLDKFMENVSIEKMTK